MSKFHDNLTQEEKASETANSLWERFKASLEEGIEKYIPHRIAGKKDSHPWITFELKKLIRKRNKLYITKRNYPSRQNINRYKESRRLVQKKFRKAYWDYVNEIVSPDKSVIMETKSFGHTLSIVKMTQLG